MAGKSYLRTLSHSENDTLLDLAEHVDVGVVHGEIENNGSGASVQPQVALQLVQNSQRLVFGMGQIFDIAATAVRCHDTLVARGVQLRRRLVVEP